MKKLFLALPLLLAGLALHAQINAGEYFFDNDPGVGNGTAISLSAGATVNHSFTVPITGLTSGIHNLFIRVKNAQNNWSHYEGRLIYILVPPSQTNSQIVSAEWFVDTDPGVGNGTAISFTASQNVSTAISLPTTNLAPGLHNLFVRVKNTEGKWSHYEGRLFYILENPPTLNHQVVSAEWFVDTDPGIGNGTSFSFAGSQNVTSAISVPTNGMAPGIHNLFVRVKNSVGKWSHYEGRLFYILENSNPGSSLLVSGEWFIDNDPGLGNGTPITFQQASSVTTLTNMSTTGLASGKHYLFIRVKDTNDHWSHYEGRSFTICNSLLSTPVVTGNDTLCAGDTMLLNASTVTGATSYYWKGPNNFTAITQNINLGASLKLMEGTYTVVATNGSSVCDTSNSASINITVNTVNNSVTNIGNIITSNTSGASYQWIDCNNGNQIISGQNSQSFAATSSGSYAVVVTENGCTDTSACENITIVGIFENFSSQIKVFPNPTKGIVTLDFGNINLNGTLKVSNIEGKLISEELIENRKSVQLDMSNNSKGIYFVTIKNKDFVRIIKLIRD